jgi:hypothetical protein
VDGCENSSEDGFGGFEGDGTIKKRRREMQEGAERPVFIASNEIEDAGKRHVEGKIGRFGGGGDEEERLAKRIMVWRARLMER